MKKYIFILLILSAAAAFFLPFQFLLNFAHDDSFFYIKTANNLSKGFGSTFDGVNITNGYHPLYFISLVILFAVPNFLASASPEFLYRLVFLYHEVLLLFSFVFLLKSLKLVLKEKYGSTLILLIIIMLAALVFIRDYGLESHLACLIISYFLFLKAKETENGRSNPVDKSVLLSLLFLTRTDFLISVIPLVLIADIFTGKEKLKHIITSFIFINITALIYYLTNYYFFGHFATVSGMLLNAFPVVLLKENINILITDPAKLYNQFARIIFFMISIILFTVFYTRNKAKTEAEKKFFGVILGFGAGSFLFVLYHLIFNTYSIREWYMTVPVFISSVMAALMAGGRKITAYITLLLSLIVLIYVFTGSRIANYKYVSGYEYAKAIEKIVGADERVYQVDYCGVTGFFSNRNIINGDGLINSFEYSGYMKNGKIDEYLKKYDVKYYSTYSSESLLKDSVYTDKTFSDKINGKIFIFDKSSLALEMPFRWSHIAFGLDGKWYLFKF
ncbi:MAG: hypothetical protein HY959_06990 [Ignavibacteriae bacterium]|nr:hypothetical protein [Ignavibacteriota bacterium]